MENQYTEESKHLIANLFKQQRIRGNWAFHPILFLCYICVFLEIGFQTSSHRRAIRMVEPKKKSRDQIWIA